MHDEWIALADAITKVLTELRWGQFAVFDYVDSLSDDAPYAQIALNPGGYYCEVVSDAYLCADRWPLDEKTLLAAGWQIPDDATLNWWMSGIDGPSEAAGLMTAALSEAHACRDASRVRWKIGAFPPPPDGGEPMPQLVTDVPAGVWAA